MGNSSSSSDPAMPQEGSARFSKLQEEITCSICLHELRDPVSIACGHTFCRTCITKYWNSPQPLGYRCPECRKICPKHQLIPAYRLQSMMANVQPGIKEERSMPDPVPTMQLVYMDRHGRLQLNESVVQRCFIDGEIAEYPLCLICVIGEKRRGKSTLLNYILRALQRQERGEPFSLGPEDEPLAGFGWRAGADTVTKGIWIWSRPFILERNGEKMAVYVLDTEGSLDIEGDRESSMKLSALSMLLSSHLIFNVGSSLKTTELDYLETYLHVAELTGLSLSLQYLQKMSLLVRDWQDSDHCGKKAARAYLQRETEKLRKTSKYRRVLETLKSPAVSGFLLPHPGKAFLKANQGRLADMDGDFRDHLTTYISDLVTGVWQCAKADLYEKKVTCAHVGEALKEFVALLQQKHYRFSSPMQMFYSLENRKMMKMFVKEFEDFLEQQVPSDSSLLEVLKVRPSQFRSEAHEKTSQLLEGYRIALRGDNADEKEALLDDLGSVLVEKEEKFCSEYTKRFTKASLKMGCVVGGGLLALATGAASGAVAGRAINLLGTTTVAVASTLGSSVALGAVGTGIGAVVGGVIGYIQKKKDSGSQQGAEESTEDTKKLVKKQD